MKIIKSIIYLLLIFQFGCKEKNENNFSLPWKTIESKGRSSRLTILVEKADKVDYLVLNNIFKIAHDSFKIEVRMISIESQKVVDLVLKDSKRGKRSVYDLIIASPEILEELDKLGLLYNDFHASLPNFKKIKSEIKNIRKANTSRIFQIPISKRCYIIAWDSCLNSGVPKDLDKDIVRIINGRDALWISYFLDNKSQNPSLSYLDIGNPKKIGDSLLANIKKKIVKQSEISDNNQMLYVMSPYIFNRLNKKFSLVSNAHKELPCLYTYASISNTSDQIFGALLLIDLMLDEQTQLKNYYLSEKYYAPVINNSENY